RKFGMNHQQTLNVVHNLAGTLRDVGRLAEAEPLLRRVYDGRRLSLGVTHKDTLRAEYALALVLYELKRYEDAETILRQHLVNVQQSKGWSATALLDAGNWLGDCLTNLKRYAEAEKMLLQVHEQLVKAQRPLVKHRRENCTNLMRLYEAWNKP